MKGTATFLARHAAHLERCALLPTLGSNALAAAWLAHGFSAQPWSDFWQSVELVRFLLVVLGGGLLWLGWSAPRPGKLGPAPAFTWAPPRWLLLGGALLIALAGLTPAILGLLLLALALADRSLAPRAWASPILQGGSRWLFYLAVATTVRSGVNGWAIWGGLVVAAFVAGSAWIIARQTQGEPFDDLPLVLLAAPMVLAWCMNNGPFFQPAALLGTVLVLWLARGLVPLRFARGAPGPAAATLTPAIVLVDWLMVADAPRTSGFLFIPLFLLAMALQRLGRPA